MTNTIPQSQLAELSNEILRLVWWTEMQWGVTVDSIELKRHEDHDTLAGVEVKVCSDICQPINKTTSPN